VSHFEVFRERIEGIVFFGGGIVHGVHRVIE